MNCPPHPYSIIGHELYGFNRCNVVHFRSGYGSKNLIFSKNFLHLRNELYPLLHQTYIAGTKMSYESNKM